MQIRSPEQQVLSHDPICETGKVDDSCCRERQYRAQQRLCANVKARYCGTARGLEGEDEGEGQGSSFFT